MHASAHFTWVAPPRIGEVVHPVLGSVKWKDLTTAQAVGLWRKGFEHLHITAAGVEHHFPGITTAERAELLAVCRTDAERALFAPVRTPRTAAPAPAPEPAAAPEEEEAPAAPTRKRKKADTPEGESPAE